MKINDIFKIAKNELKSLSSIPDPDFRLEQAEFKTDESIWEIVISYLVENKNKREQNVFASFTTDLIYTRIYKKVKLDKNNDIIGFFIFDSKE